MTDPKAVLAPNVHIAEPSQSPHTPAPRSPARRRLDCVCRLARGVLVVYMALLFFVAVAGHWHGLTVKLEDMVQWGDLIARVLTAGGLLAAQFLALGFLAALSARPPTRPRRFRKSLGRWLLVVLVGTGLFALLGLAESGRLPGVAASLVACTGYLAGVLIGSASQRGPRAALWLVPQLGLFVLVIGAIAAGLALMAVDEAPLPFQPPKVTSAEKRRLVDILEHSRLTSDGFRQLRLSERDVNLLLALGIPEVLPTGKARLTLDEGTIGGDLSLRIAGGDSGSRARWVNVHGVCRAGLTAGRPEIRLTECRVGRVSIPQALLDDFSRQLTAAILDDPDLEHVVAAIDSVRLEPGSVETAFRSGELSGEVIRSLIARLGQKPDVLTSTRIHIRHLVGAAEDLPEQQRFEAFLQAAFGLAQERSQVEDPVLENRAAILALAILLGHWRVESLVGSVTDGDLRAAARQRVGRVSLRDRGDWCKHFWVSAALALLSNESLSDQAGLLKEELDAGEGGSGFSFSDFLADRAGTLFALAATRDEPSARRMQDRLAAGPEIDEIFPPASDLPEGIPDVKLQTEYGGGGGEKYNQGTEEIERRLATCAALE